MDSTMYLCDKCKRDFQFGEIKYDGKRILCSGCFERANQPEEIPAAKIICERCRYKFTLKKAPRLSLACPYCGGTSLVRDETTAARLLAEVS